MRRLVAENEPVRLDRIVQRAQIEDLRSALDAPAAEGQRAEAPADLLDMAPTEDGRIVPQAQALAAEPRENVLANIIQLCEV